MLLTIRFDRSAVSTMISNVSTVGPFSSIWFDGSKSTTCIPSSSGRPVATPSTTSMTLFSMTKRRVILSRAGRCWGSFNWLRF